MRRSREVSQIQAGSEARNARGNHEPAIGPSAGALGSQRSAARESIAYAPMSCAKVTTNPRDDLTHMDASFQEHITIPRQGTLWTLHTLRTAWAEFWNV